MILLKQTRRPWLVLAFCAVLLLLIRVHINRQQQLAYRAGRIVGRTQEHERTWRETFVRHGSNDTKT